MFTDTWYEIGRALVSWLARGVFELSVKWHAPLPEGPLLLAANHPSTIDPALITTLAPQRITILIRQSLFKVPLFGRSLRACGHIEVIRGSGGSSLEQAYALLKAGRTVAVFPEGEISPQDGTRNHAHSGLARLALRSGAPVVPVGIHLDPKQLRHVPTNIDGIDETGAWYFNGPYAMTIGAAQHFEGSCEDRQRVSEVTSQVMESIYSLAAESARRVRTRRRMGWIGAPAWYIGSPVRFIRTWALFGGLRTTF